MKNKNGNEKDSAESCLRSLRDNTRTIKDETNANRYYLRSTAQSSMNTNGWLGIIALLNFLTLLAVVF